MPLCLFVIGTLNTSYADPLNEQEKALLTSIKNDALSSDLSYQILESLTTEVGPRLTGTKGDELGVQWAVAKMQSLGFDKVWTEAVPYTVWHRGNIQAKIVAPFPQDVSATALGGSVATAQEGISAEIAHFDTLADLKNAKPEEVKGKIAFISFRMSQHIEGAGYGKAVGARGQGASIAAEKGAVAFILRSVGTDNNRLAHTGMMRYKNEVTKIPAAAISNPDADLLVNQLKRGAVTFYLNLSSSSNPEEIVNTANVIGEITGSELPNEIVALGAHLDSWDLGTGAMDDGMSVGIVMATGAHLAQLPKRPKRTVRVILFAAEEVGLLGAKQYIIDHQNEMNQHKIGAEWDFGLGKIYQMNAGVGETAYKSLSVLAQELAPLGVSFSPDNNAKAQSDMGLLTKAGMPSMNFSPDGTKYFDYHHTSNDTLDKISPEDMQFNTTIYTLFAYFAAQANVDFSK